MAAVFAAWLAWHSVQKQIASQKDIEANRQEDERQNLKTALTAELLCFSSSLIEAASNWNRRALQEARKTTTALPRFIAPKVYYALLPKIGLLTEGWPAMAVITFYGVLSELHELSAEQPGRTVGEISKRLRIMATNLAHALDGLNADRQFPIPPEVVLEILVAPDGRIIGNDGSSPNSIQELLQRLGR